MTLQQKAPGNSIILSDHERMALEDLALHHRGRSVQARRARIILLSADGHSAAEICRMLGCSGQTVTSWRRRFLRTRSLGRCGAAAGGNARA